MGSLKLKRKADTQQSEQTLQAASAAERATLAVEAVNNVPAEIRLADDEKWLTFPEARHECLLPDLPNDITLDRIVPKLGWRDIYTLSAVSPAWCHAIRSRQVFDARVHSGSTETLVIYCHERKEHRYRLIVPAVSIYLMEDGIWLHLPPIFPARDGAGKRLRRCLGLNGKIYLLDVESRKRGGSLNTFVFDVAGQRQWRKCSAMRVEGNDYHSDCEYGLLGGKIYALGGCSGKNRANFRGSNQVYDPVENTWSAIKPMTSLRVHHDVVTVGEELYVCGGRGGDNFYDKYGIPIKKNRRETEGMYYDDSPLPITVQVYHPGRGAWRVLPGSLPPQDPGQDRQVLVEMEGKCMWLSGCSIYDYTLDGKRPTLLHTISSVELLGSAEHAYACSLYVWVAEAVGDELLAVLEVEYHGRFHEYPAAKKVFIVRCKGLGSENKNLTWQRVKTPRFFHPKSMFHRMSRIDL